MLFRMGKRVAATRFAALIATICCLSACGVVGAGPDASTSAATSSSTGTSSGTGTGTSSGTGTGTSSSTGTGSSSGTGTGASSGTGTGTSSGTGTGSSSSTGTATLAWTAPTHNTNGTPLTDLAGYTILYGTDANNLTNTINVPSPSTTTYEISNLSHGTYYFEIVAYASGDVESPPSNVGSITI